MSSSTRFGACVLALVVCAGCASGPPPSSGFLSDYGALLASADGSRRYVSPELRNYGAFIVDPVQVRSRRTLRSVQPADQVELAEYFDRSMASALKHHGHRVVQTPGPGVARIRVALTGFRAADWWRDYPFETVSLIGTGGASMEGEVIDSVTGRQLAAVVQRGRGQYATIDEFTTIDDIRNTIDQWTHSAAMRVDAMRMQDP